MSRITPVFFFYKKKKPPIIFLAFAIKITGGHVV
jgi:hypothetical protein